MDWSDYSKKGKTSEHYPPPEKDYTERVKIVPYDDGWPEYEEAVIEF